MRIGRTLFIYFLAGLLVATGLQSGLHSDSVSDKAQAADLAHMQSLDLPMAGGHDDAEAPHWTTHCHSAAGCLVAMLPGPQQPPAALKSEVATISVQSATLTIAAPLTRPPIT